MTWPSGVTLLPASPALLDDDCPPRLPSTADSWANSSSLSSWMATPSDCGGGGARERQSDDQSDSIARLHACCAVYSSPPAGADAATRPHLGTVAEARRTRRLCWHKLASVKAAGSGVELKGARPARVDGWMDRVREEQSVCMAGATSAQDHRATCLDCPASSDGRPPPVMPQAYRPPVLHPGTACRLKGNAVFGDKTASGKRGCGGQGQRCAGARSK